MNDAQERDVSYKAPQPTPLLAEALADCLGSLHSPQPWARHSVAMTARGTCPTAEFSSRAGAGRGLARTTTDYAEQSRDSRGALRYSMGGDRYG